MAGEIIKSDRRWCCSALRNRPAKKGGRLEVRYESWDRVGGLTAHDEMLSNCAVVGVWSTNGTAAMVKKR